MSQFLSNFMRAAHSITKAKRCIALDMDKNVLDSINIDERVLDSANFNELLISSIETAFQQGQAIITNNMITDPSQAPTTNVHLKDLRMVVAIPVNGFGAIYLDQPIRDGVFERETINRLHDMCHQIIEDGSTDISESEIAEIYHEK